jgi:redox-sensitive bicupin YhaK (pirin superfamily)
MKKIIHKAEDRGYADHGWLKARHSFSFAEYSNREKMNFGLLRVLNDDIVEPGEGFGEHPHDNMEIVTIPLEGELEHKDSTGTSGVIRVNDIQIMSAGSGVYHSEFNHSDKNLINLLQTWVFPKEQNITPRYDQITLDPGKRKNKIYTFVSPEKGKDKLWINQDAYFSLCDLDKSNSANYKIQKEGNGVYIFLIEGKIKVEDETLSRRDAIGIWETSEIIISAEENSKVLFIEVPMDRKK